MPTKTRLDPTAGGESPPAGQDGAHGSGRGDNSASARAPATPPVDVTGFIDSLAALSAHLREREAFEADARRGWTRMAAWSALLIPLEVFSWVYTNQEFSFDFLLNQGHLIAIHAAALLSALIAVLAFMWLAAVPWRANPDHVDRVALRHEDSPLRDRIRITQWILFDSVHSRYAYQRQRINSAIAHGILLIAVIALFSVAFTPFFEMALRAANIYNLSPTLALATFLLLTLVAVWRLSVTARRIFRDAQQYGRQVLSFNDDFGGFLPRGERTQVEEFVALAGGKVSVDEEEHK